jgi:hypothetical protein
MNAKEFYGYLCVAELRGQGVRAYSYPLGDGVDADVPDEAVQVSVETVGGEAVGGEQCHVEIEDRGEHV